MAAEAHKLCASFGAEVFFAPKQVHGDRILDLSDPALLNMILDGNHGGLEIEADGIFVNSRQLSKRTVLGIRSADCVPIIFRSGEEYLLLHAGWRGLANGIIKKGMALLSNGGEMQALIGPCAGIQKYEVGYEVIEAIGPSAAAMKDSSIWHLDLAITAKNQIEEISRAEVFVSNICSIEDQRFHSHRREGEKAGRALAFVVLGGPK